MKPLVAALAIAVGTAACEHDRPAPPAPAASVLPVAAPVVSTVAPPKAPCRAASVTGAVTPTLLAGADVPKAGWIDIGPKSKVVVRDPRTTREVMLVGPAHARACVRDDEESWLVTGTFESSAGAGESPGAEEWVATPYALIRYAAASLRVTVGPDGANVKVERGAAQIAFVPPAKPAEARPAIDAGNPDDAAWMRLDAGQTAVIIWVGQDSDTSRAHEAFDQCVRSGRKARALATQIAAPGAAVGELTPRHVAARRMARAACAVAEVRAELLVGPARAAQLEKIHEANGEWSKIGP